MRHDSINVKCYIQGQDSTKFNIVDVGKVTECSISVPTESSNIYLLKSA